MAPRPCVVPINARRPFGTKAEVTARIAQRAKRREAVGDVPPPTVAGIAPAA